MGYMRDHAIVVSSWDAAIIRKAWIEAKMIFVDAGMRTLQYKPMKILEPVESPANGHLSFFIPPDGSKEGWGCSDYYDDCRERFKTWAKKQRYEDGSTSLRWVEIQFADDEHETIVIDHSDKTCLALRRR